MLLEECPEKYHSTSGALLVGNPWVETVRLKGCRPFQQLPGAEEEVKMIGQILNTEPLTGKNATKDQVSFDEGRCIKRQIARQACCPELL